MITISRRLQGDLQVILERIEAVEEAVLESLLAQLVPDMFDRVEFGA